MATLIPLAQGVRGTFPVHPGANAGPTTSNSSGYSYGGGFLPPQDPASKEGFAAWVSANHQFWGNPKSGHELTFEDFQNRYVEILPQGYERKNLEVQTQWIIEKAKGAYVYEDLLPVEEFFGGTTYEVDQIIFNEHRLDIEPEMTAPRLVTYNRRSWSESLTRMGLAAFMEHGLANIFEGAKIWMMHCAQISKALKDALAMKGIIRLLTCRGGSDNFWNYYRTTTPAEVRDAIKEQEIREWDCVFKGIKGLEAAAFFGIDRVAAQGGETPDTIIVPFGSKPLLRLADQQVFTVQRTPDKFANVEAATQMRIIVSEQFPFQDGAPKQDPMESRRSIGELFVSSNAHLKRFTKWGTYKTFMRNITMYDEKAKNLVELDIVDIFKASGLFDYTSNKRTSNPERPTPIGQAFFENYGDNFYAYLKKTGTLVPFVQSVMAYINSPLLGASGSANRKARFNAAFKAGDSDGKYRENSSETVLVRAEREVSAGRAHFIASEANLSNDDPEYREADRLLGDPAGFTMAFKLKPLYNSMKALAALYLKEKPSERASRLDKVQKVFSNLKVGARCIGKAIAACTTAEAKLSAFNVYVERLGSIAKFEDLILLPNFTDLLKMSGLDAMRSFISTFNNSVADSTEESQENVDPSLADDMKALDNDIITTLAEAPFLRKSFNFILENDLFLPINFYIAQPHKMYAMCDIIVMKAGKSTGSVLLGNSNFMLGKDNTLKTVLGHYTANVGVKLLAPQNVAVVHNAFCKRYISGGSTRFWDPNSIVDINNYASGHGTKDLFVFAEYPDKEMRTELDITGIHHEQYIDKSVPGDDAPQYSMCDTYASIWGFEHGRAPFDVDFDDASNYRNTRCFQATQFNYKPTGIDEWDPMGVYTGGIGHWGASVYQDVSGDRRGIGPHGYIAEVNWNMRNANVKTPYAFKGQL